MLKSFCIKTNNNRIANYLLNKFDKVNLENVYISKLKFKLYNNFIVHYKGKNLDEFYNIFSYILSSAILKFYEKKIIKHIIDCNYFYFSNIEQRKIFDIACKYLSEGEIDEICIRKNTIIFSCLDYFSNYKSAILDGFVSFRLTNYIKIIDYVVDLSVNKFIIDREYTEFIDLLKCYINSKEFGSKIVHLIYQNGESTLLDEYKKTITINDNVLNSKFLSDITFSSNDYTLNALLTLLPEKIYIHMINGKADEFINTLKLIFDDRIYMCTDCTICKAYRLEKINR